MNLGDHGAAVLAFQRAVGFPANMCDGECGNDTLYRWRADNDPTLPWMLVRALRLIGVITDYSMSNPGPHANDCSGGVCLALGISKGPDALVHWWKNTTGILRDAFAQDLEFHDVGPEDDLTGARPGDLLCYGGANGNVGHIAMVVDPRIKLVWDVSGSHDGAHVHDASYFWRKKVGRPVYCLRFVGPAAPMPLAA